MSRYQPPKMQLGFSLLEILLASALGIFLLASLIEVYLSIKASFNLQTSFAYLADNGRFASYYLTRAIHMAGNEFCQLPLDNSFPIEGYQNSMPAFLRNQVLKHTSVLQIHACRTIDHHIRYLPIWFFIGATGRVNAYKEPIYALYELVDHHKQELVPNVDNMQIWYRISISDGKAVEKYLQADEVDEWRLVHVVKIALLLSSDNKVWDQPQSFNFSGTSNLNDRFLHKKWVFYVSLRSVQ